MIASEETVLYATLIALGIAYIATVAAFVAHDRALLAQKRLHPRNPHSPLADLMAQADQTRHARRLAEPRALQTYDTHHPLAGKYVQMSEYPADEDVITEIRTVESWGRELRRLESVERAPGDPETLRHRNILRMLKDSEDITRTLPPWWRLDK